MTMLAAFWMLSFSLVIVPGADWAYVISAGLQQRAIAPAVAGLLVAYLLLTLVVAAGIGALIVSIPGALSVLTLLGACYLLWLGVGTLATPAQAPQGNADNASDKNWFMHGVVNAGLNPKALLLFIALLPQFVSRGSAWPASAQIVVLGLVQIINCALVYTLVGIGARRILRARPQLARHISQFSGVAMIAIATWLLFEQFVQGK